MKKLVTALMGAGLLVSLNSFAVSSDCSNSGLSTGICAPKFCGGFYAGVTGLYYHTTATGGSLSGESFQFVNTDRDLYESRLHRFDPDHEWNWEAKIGYELPCTANNIELSYTRINNDDHIHSDLTEGPASVGSYFFPNVLIPTTGLLALTDFDAKSRLRYDFDKVDLTIGRTYSDACGNFTIRPSLGLRYAKIDQKYNNGIEGTIDFAGFGTVVAPATTPFFLNTEVQSEFKGTGPMFALDARWGVFSGIGLVGHFDSSLLVGDTDSHSRLSFEFTDPAFVAALETLSTIIGPTGGLDFFPIAEERFNVPSTDHVVTSLTGRIGLDYHFCFCNKSSLAVEVGYQASKYYDALDLIRGNVQNPLGVPALTGISNDQNLTSVDTHNFEFRGPYVNVTFHV